MTKKSLITNSILSKYSYKCAHIQTMFIQMQRSKHIMHSNQDMRCKTMQILTEIAFRKDTYYII
jgi:hypothetical protein